MNIVAGSTMSAQRAVSVMNCSCTQTNRSSRAKPRRTRLLSGAHRQRDCCSGSASRAPAARRAAPSRSPVSTLPIRLMSRMRIVGSIASRPSISVLSQLIDAAIRPQRAGALVLPLAGDRRQAGHRVHDRRTVARCARSRSRRGCSYAACVQYSRAKSSICCTGRPVIAAAHSGDRATRDAPPAPSGQSA